MVYDILLDKINSGELKTGYKYTAKELAEQMSISRTPVNEAVKLLAEQGYITVVPKSGFTVNKYYWEDVEEIAQIINYIERMVFSRILNKNEQIKTKDMLAFCNAMLLAIESGDGQAYSAAYLKLHEAMFRHAKVNLVSDVFKRYWNYTEWYNISTPERKTMMEEICKDYMRAICALEQRDTHELERIMNTHLERMLQFLSICLKDISIEHRS